MQRLPDRLSRNILLLCNRLLCAWSAGYREACELAYAQLEKVSVNNSSDKQRFRQVINLHAGLLAHRTSFFLSPFIAPTERKVQRAALVYCKCIV